MNLLLCLCLFVSAANAAGITQVIQYKGVSLAVYSDFGFQFIEPYFEFDLKKMPAVRKNILDNSWYMTLPIRIKNLQIRSRNGQKTQERGLKRFRTPTVTSFSVSIRKGFVDQSSSSGDGVSASSIQTRKGFFVMLRCPSAEFCNRIADALRYKTPDTDMIRNAFKFEFSVRAKTLGVSIVKRGIPVNSYGRLSGAKYFESNRILLYTLEAESNHSAYSTFVEEGHNEIPKGQQLPKIFRSDWLDKLPEAVRMSRMSRIVFEMRKAGKMVAQVKFDLTANTNSLTTTNWFDKNRVLSSFPYNIKDKTFNFFSVSGHENSRQERFFFINFNYGGCENDAGFMAVIEKPDNCNNWGRKAWRDTKPIFAFNPTDGAKWKDAVQFADRVVVYLEGEAASASAPASVE